MSLERRFNVLIGTIAKQELKQLHRCIGVAHGAVAVMDMNAEMPAQTAQTVGRKSWKGSPAQPHCAKLAAIKVVTHLLQVVFQERIIKIDVVRHEDAAVEQSVKVSRNLFKCRRFFHHSLGDACESRDVYGDLAAGIDERLKPAFLLDSVVQHNSHLCDGVISCVTAGCLYINYGIHRVDKDTETRSRIRQNPSVTLPKTRNLVRTLMV